MVLGFTDFVSIKCMEYHTKYLHGLMPLMGLPFKWDGPSPGHAEMFFDLYFVMTGVHALHMLIGLGIMLVLVVKAHSRWSIAGRFCGARSHDGTLLAFRRSGLGLPVSASLSDRSALAMSHKRSADRRLLAVYVALLVLLALTVEAARHDLGHWNFAVTLMIAVAKATLIALFFMHIWHGPPLIKLVLAASLIWLAIMFSLSLADYWTRPWDLFVGGLPEALQSTNP